MHQYFSQGREETIPSLKSMYVKHAKNIPRGVAPKAPQSCSPGSIMLIHFAELINHHQQSAQPAEPTEAACTKKRTVDEAELEDTDVPEDPCTTILSYMEDKKDRGVSFSKRKITMIKKVGQSTFFINLYP